MSMKKLSYGIVGIIIVLLAVDFFFTHLFLIPQSINFYKNIPFDNTCQVDEDCVLAKLELSCKTTCGDYLVDYAEKEYVSVNSKNLTAFSSSWYKESCKNTKFDPPTCLFVMPQYKNTNHVAVCKKNTCQKGIK